MITKLVTCWSDGFKINAIYGIRWRYFAEEGGLLVTMYRWNYFAQADWIFISPKVFTSAGGIPKTCVCKAKLFQETHDRKNADTVRRTRREAVLRLQLWKQGGDVGVWRTAFLFGLKLQRYLVAQCGSSLDFPLVLRTRRRKLWQEVARMRRRKLWQEGAWKRSIAVLLEEGEEIQRQNDSNYRKAEAAIPKQSLWLTSAARLATTRLESTGSFGINGEGVCEKVWKLVKKNQFSFRIISKFMENKFKRIDIRFFVPCVSMLARVVEGARWPYALKCC
jgi:hypothetical protein